MLHLLKLKSFRKAVALFGVYALHLICFQVLMQAAPSHNIDNSFKPLFSNHTSKGQSSQHNSKHPAVTYYSIMIKQGKDVNGTIRPVAPVIIQSEAAVPPSPFFLSAIFPVFRAMLRPLHLAEDSFRLYSLMKTFLI